MTYYPKPTREWLQELEDRLNNLVIEAGSGNVVGPASAVDGEVLVSDGTTGKLLKKSNILYSQLALTADTRFTNARPPTGAAGGSLGGSYPNPSVLKLNEAGGTALSIGTIPDGSYVIRSGSSLVGTSTLLAAATGLKLASVTLDCSTASTPNPGDLAVVDPLNKLAFRSPSSLNLGASSSSSGGTAGGAAVTTSDDFQLNSTTLADVTGVQISLAANTGYHFIAHIPVTQSDASGTVGVSVNYTGTFSALTQEATLASSSTAASFKINNANNTALTDNSTRSTGGPFPTKLGGFIKTTTAGSLVLRAQRSAGTTVFGAGTSLSATPLASSSTVATGGGGSSGGGTPSDPGGGTVTPTPTGTAWGVNFWFIPNCQPFASGVNWATAYGSGTNGLADTNIWASNFLADITPFTTLRFMDWGNTNWQTIVNWADRRLPTSTGNATTGNWDGGASEPGMAYEWMIDLSNRTGKDFWVCIPARANDDYVTQLATLIKSKLSTARKIYVEFSNEVWNTGFGGTLGQWTYCRDQATAVGLPAANDYYKPTVYAAYRSYQCWKLFQDVFGSAAMGTRVFRVFSNSANSDFMRAALTNTYTSSTWNPNNQHIDMLCCAPYIGLNLNGSDANVMTQYRAAVDASPSGTDGINTYAAMKTQFGIPLLGFYECGQSLASNQIAFGQNSAVYNEYYHMADVFASTGVNLSMHYTLHGQDSNYAWGLKTTPSQTTANAHKFRAITDWITAHPLT